MRTSQSASPSPVLAGVDPMIAKYMRFTDRELDVMRRALSDARYIAEIRNSPAREYRRRRLVDQLERVLEWREL